MRARYDDGAVLVIEDDPELLARFREAMRADDVLVIPCRSLQAATEGIRFHRPAVVVADLEMEGGHGWELLHRAASRSGERWLALDRRADPVARRAALAAGADDVASAPFDAAEIAARVRALRDRGSAAGQRPVLRHGELLVDISAREVRVAGKPVELTVQQFEILRALCEARGATMHRSQLLARIAAIDDEPPSDRAIDLHVSRLRRRLGEAGGRYIESVYGIGYRLVPAKAEAALPGDVASAVVEAMDEGVIVTDGALRIRAANRAAARILEREDLVGRSCEEVMGCRTPEGAALTGPACIGRAVLAGGGRIANVRTCVGCRGWWMDVELSHSPVEIDGGPGLLAIEIRREPH
jgi:DNA-binding response OmpR family regulator